MTRFKAPLPKRFEGAGWDAFDTPDAVTKAVLRKAKEWSAAHVDSTDTGKGLLLLGPAGRGKTMLACITAQETADAVAAPCGYVTIASYQQATHRIITLSNALNDPDLREEWKARTEWMTWLRTELPILVLDDLGKEHTTSSRHIEDEVDFLLRTRYDRGLPTLVTTNYTADDFAEKYSLAMHSFIHEAYEFIPVLKLDDIRIRNSK